MEFGIILALVAIFRSEQANMKTTNQDEFMQWLERHNFSALKGQIEANAIVLNAIESILQEDRAIFSARFDDVDKMLATIASGVEGLKNMAVVLRPDAQISDQAISILRNLLDSGAQALIVFMAQGGPSVLLSGGTPSTVECVDPQFLNDDLETLVEMRCLRFDGYNSSNAPIYRPTREGREYLRMIDAG